MSRHVQGPWFRKSKNAWHAMHQGRVPPSVSSARATARRPSGHVVASWRTAGIRGASRGLSRAREAVIVLASRAEMREHCLRPLVPDLALQVLRRAGKSLDWIEVPAVVEFTVPDEIAWNSDLLGHQIAGRKSLRPVVSAEQQRLCG